MNAIYLKYNHLDSQLKKEVETFIDFLLAKKQKEEKNVMSSYQQKILQISQWNDDDISCFNETKASFNQLNIQSW